MVRSTRDGDRSRGGGDRSRGGAGGTGESYRRAEGIEYSGLGAGVEKEQGGRSQGLDRIFRIGTS